MIFEPVYLHVFIRTIKLAFIVRPGDLRGTEIDPTLPVLPTPTLPPHTSIMPSITPSQCFSVRFIVGVLHWCPERVAARSYCPGAAFTFDCGPSKSPTLLSLPKQRELSCTPPLTIRTNHRVSQNWSLSTRTLHITDCPQGMAIQQAVATHNKTQPRHR
jgi:hypothetical protein